MAHNNVKLQHYNYDTHQMESDGEVSIHQLASLNYRR
jgi:hypothetical protein